MLRRAARRLSLAALVGVALCSPGCARRSLPPQRLQVYADVQRLAVQHPLFRQLPQLQARAQALERAELRPLPKPQVGSAEARWQVPLPSPQYEDRERRLKELEKAAESPPPSETARSQQPLDRVSAREQAIRDALADRFVLGLSEIGPAWRDALRTETLAELGETVALLAHGSAPGLTDAERQDTESRLQGLRADRLARAYAVREQKGLLLMQQWASAGLALANWTPQQEGGQAAAPPPTEPSAEQDLQPSLEALKQWSQNPPPKVAGLEVPAPTVRVSSSPAPSEPRVRAAAAETLGQVGRGALVQILLDTATAALQAAQTRGWDLSITKREGRRDVTETIRTEVAAMLTRENVP